MRGWRIRLAACWCAVGCVGLAHVGRAQPPPVVASGGKLVYERDERGNRIADFSHCGYAGGDAAIPDVPVHLTVEPAAGDDGPRIQAAIDRVAALPADDNGLRGAVRLGPGEFQIAGQLRITASGVVLRGAGAGDGGTTLRATGQDRRPLVRIAGLGDRQIDRSGQYRVADAYVPVGADRLQLNTAGGLHVGDRVLVTRPSTLAWIQALGMDAFGVAWKPGTRDIRWDRIITAVDGDSLSLDAPITTAIESEFGGAVVEPYDWPGRVEQVGIEDLRLETTYAADNLHDEDHAWLGVTIENAQNAWLRRVEFRHFAGGAVALWESTKWITVEDCISLAPVSELGGYRRHTFFTQGQLALFLRCWSERGRHDFAVGHCAAGPNAFVNCYAAAALDDSGPLESWASGVLYDNVRVDGAGLDLKNRWINPPGAGWSAANCVLWQCQAATMHCERPPTANNWAVGVWAGFSGDATFAARSDFVRPISLYEGQLRERVGAEHAGPVRLGLVDPIGSTNPTIAEAARFAQQSRRPAGRLVDVIRARMNEASRHHVAQSQVPSSEHQVPIAENAIRRIDDANRRPPDAGQALSDLPADKSSPALALRKPTDRLTVRNGWLVAADKVVTGGAQGQSFWRGTIRPDEAAAFGASITRFVPGRVGPGFTDDLDELAADLLRRGVAVFDHHYGLWYDRRRDDHTMVRQKNGDVAPPFYEQPFARTGDVSHRAWDGLSKYDLQRFNPWYWNRLREFARQCDRRGLVLIHQNYFQHNILEAGAHWADCPWRPANNVNDTGLPEPPPYVGDKRIFMAANFYDVTSPGLCALHRGYIRQCLENFADTSNVIQMTSAEYSGPLEFTQFWLDTILEWEREQGRGSREQGAKSSTSHALLRAPGFVLVGLSAPKDVQDAILKDPVRGPRVDVIDIRYWAYTADGGLYAPKGGQHLAPRQHLRQTRQKPSGFAAIVRAVREYRTRYPEKAVTYFADLHCPSGRYGWAVLIGGGSLANVKLPDELARAVASMRPTDEVVRGVDRWCLADGDKNYLIYDLRGNGTLELNLPPGVAYDAMTISTDSGDITSEIKTAAGAGSTRLPLTGNAVWLRRVGLANEGR